MPLHFAMFSIKERQIHLKRAEKQVNRLHKLLRRALLVTSQETVAEADIRKHSLPEWTMDNNPVFMPGEITLHKDLERWVKIAERCKRMAETMDLSEEGNRQEGGSSSQATATTRSTRSRSRASRAPRPAIRNYRNLIPADCLALLVGHMERFENIRDAIKKSINSELERVSARKVLYGNPTVREHGMTAIMRSRGKKSPLSNCTLSSDI